MKNQFFDAVSLLLDKFHVEFVSNGEGKSGESVTLELNDIQTTKCSGVGFRFLFDLDCAVRRPIHAKAAATHCAPAKSPQRVPFCVSNSLLDMLSL